MWIGRINGLAHIDGQAWNAVPVAEGLNSPSVSSIAFAPDGSLWCGLMRLGAYPSYGAGRFDGREWTIFSVGDGLGHVDVYAIAAGLDGSL